MWSFGKKAGVEAKDGTYNPALPARDSKRSVTSLLQREHGPLSCFPLRTAESKEGPSGHQKEEGLFMEQQL